jgi:hypothetical protein
VTTVVRVFADPTLEAFERARLALEAELPGVSMAATAEPGGTVVVAQWPGVDLDGTRQQRARAVLVEHLAAAPTPPVEAAVRDHLEQILEQSVAALTLLSELLERVEALETATVASIATGKAPAASART